MQLWITGVFLKPFIALVFFVGVVFPLVLAFDRIIPAGRLKAVLWRDVTSPAAPMRTRVIVTIVQIALWATLIGFGIWFNSSN